MRRRFGSPGGALKGFFSCCMKENCMGSDRFGGTAMWMCGPMG
jgi:hypothetical protein